MTKLITTIALAATVSVAALAAVGTASAAPRHETAVERQAGPGYYEGVYQENVDNSDHASSPYAGGGGN